MGQAVVALMVVRYLTQAVVIAVCSGLIDWASGDSPVKAFRIAFALSCGFALLSAGLAAFAVTRSARPVPASQW